MTSDPDALLALADSALETPITQPLPPSTLTTLLSHPPFISVPGTYNFRDVSLAPADEFFPTLTADTEEICPLAPGKIFRCGSLHSLKGEGIANLKMLGVKKVFDLRADKERVVFPSPLEDLKKAGIEVYWQPDPVEVEAELVAGDVEGNVMGLGKVEKAERMMKEAGVRYSHETPIGRAIALEVSGLFTLRDIYKRFFEALLEIATGKVEGTILFHCLAGKDRTGVLSTLLHLLAGSDQATIIHDFRLSRIGVEQGRSFLTSILKKKYPDIEDGDDGLVKSRPELATTIGTVPEVWEGFLLAMEKMGGAEWYLHDLGFSSENIEKIRQYIIKKEDEE